MPEFADRSWVITSPSDALVPGARDGFPVWLAKELLEQYGTDSFPVLDPFLGNGTTIVAADHLNMSSFGVELDLGRVKSGRKFVNSPEKIFHGDALTFDFSKFGIIGTILTSPPFIGIQETSSAGLGLRIEDICRVLIRLRDNLWGSGKLIVEMIDVPRDAGDMTKDVFSTLLSRYFDLDKQLIVCDLGAEPIAGSVFHTYVQTWSPKKLKY